MPRTTLEQMVKICDIDDDVDVADFIATANELVTECCTGAKGPTTAYSDARLELIERWLACHFLCIQFPQAAQESVGKLSEQAQQRVDLGFFQTRYGQQAMAMDTHGTLALLNKQMNSGVVKPKVGIFWVGGPPRNATC